MSATGMLDCGCASDPRVAVSSARTRRSPDARRRCAVSAGPERRRRLVHLAAQGARRPCSRACAALTTCWRWSSRSSRSAAARVGKGGVVRAAERRARRAARVGGSRARARRGGAWLAPPGCRGRRAISRPSSGSRSRAWRGRVGELERWRSRSSRRSGQITLVHPPPRHETRAALSALAGLRRRRWRRRCASTPRRPPSTR